MAEASFMQMIDLLERANSLGIQMYADNNELLVKYGKDTQIDATFLAELKSRKEDLLSHFRNYNYDEWNLFHRVKKENKGILHESKIYYGLTPSQRFWTASGNEDKTQAFRLIGFRIKGQFSEDIFSKAVAHVVKRHESFRAVLDKAGSEYLLHFKGYDSSYAISFSDHSADPEAAEDALFFRDHHFSFPGGSLFLVRLIRIGAEEYLVGFKMHQLICDESTVGILMKDLITTYTAFEAGETPRLPALNFQFRDYMAYSNHLAQANREVQKKYWESAYAHVPGTLQVLDSRPLQKLAEPATMETGFLSGEAMDWITRLARRNRTDMFVLLQALFMNYLRQLTGQNDLLVAIIVPGRDDPKGAGHQAGFYSRLDFVRTVFEDDDTLEEVIGRVKRSNAGTLKYRSYTLLDAMQELLPPGSELYGGFWKFTLHHAEVESPVAEGAAPEAESPAGVREISAIPAPFINQFSCSRLDLLFMESKESITLKIVYDSLLYAPPEIHRFAEGYILYVNSLYSQRVKAGAIGEHE